MGEREKLALLLPLPGVLEAPGLRVLAGQAVTVALALWVRDTVTEALAV